MPRARRDSPGITLSVEHGNFAHSLYRSEGFAVVDTGGGRDTMVRVLG